MKSLLRVLQGRRARTSFHFSLLATELIHRGATSAAVTPRSFRLEPLEERAMLSSVPLDSTGLVNADDPEISADAANTQSLLSADAAGQSGRAIETADRLSYRESDVGGNQADLPGAVLFLPGELYFSGEDDQHLEVAHHRDLAVTDGTVSLWLTVEELSSGWQALFSKDASGQAHGGHLTAVVDDDGRVKVRLQQPGEGQEWISTPEGSIEAGQEYHLAITFGQDGFRLYLNGLLSDLELDYTQGIDTNPEPIAIGANIWGRSPEKPDYATDHLQGVIRDFTIYDSQLSRQQIKQLAGVQDDPPLAAPEVIDGVLVGTLEDDAYLHAALAGVNTVYGDYGNDLLLANPTAGPVGGQSPSEALELEYHTFANVLDGGHGNDVLYGSEHRDLLISMADGREPEIAQPWDAQDDPYGELDPLTNTYYSRQPIEGDDVLIGGRGGDLFYFQTQINAKERIILKHINSDGTIEWGSNGVAGENDNVHDHWVDGFGHDLIADFNREEGDHIFIEGHTTETYHVEYIDSDGDHNLDTTVLHIWSNQAGGGAHDEDQLGTITVRNVLLGSSDYTINKQDYGIVPTIAELDEAITPYSSTPDNGASPPIGPVDDGEQLPGVVLHAPGELYFSGEDEQHMEVAHHRDLAVTDGTVSLWLTVEELSSGWQALFSKDASGQAHGGHLTAVVDDDGRVKVRLQQPGEGQEWISTPEGSIEAGQEYHLAITFGQDGFRLYLNGLLSDLELDYTQGIDTNPEPIAIGANIWGRSPEKPDYATDHLQGVIRDFTIYDSQLSEQRIEALAGIGDGRDDGVDAFASAPLLESADRNGTELQLVDRVFESIGTT